MTNTGKFDVPLLPIREAVNGLFVAYQFWVAWVGSQRKRPQRAFLCWHCRAATRSTCVPLTQGNKLMIYTFLIAGGVRSLSDLKRIRTISVVAQSELLAREQLTGLPLVFKSRTPSSEEAA